MQHKVEVMRISFHWLLALLAAPLAVAATAAGQDAGPDYPVLLKPLGLTVPHECRHLIPRDATALVALRVDEEGRVVDWVGLDLPHPALFKAIGRALAHARFSPALWDGEPVPVDCHAYIRVGEAALGVLSVNMAEHIESRMVEVAPDLNRVVLSQARQLDQPLRLLSEGTPVRVIDDDGVPLSGSVAVEFYVDQEGRPRMIRTAEGPHPALREATIMTVEGFRFEPPRSHGRPTVVKARITLEFS